MELASIQTHTLCAAQADEASGKPSPALDRPWSQRCGHQQRWGEKVKHPTGPQLYVLLSQARAWVHWDAGLLLSCRSDTTPSGRSSHSRGRESLCRPRAIGLLLQQPGRGLQLVVSVSSPLGTVNHPGAWSVASSFRVLRPGTPLVVSEWGQWDSEEKRKQVNPQTHDDIKSRVHGGWGWAGRARMGRI